MPIQIVTNSGDGGIYEDTLEISETEKVRKIREHLRPKDSTSLKLYKLCTEVSLDDTVGEVFDEHDTVTVFKEEEKEAGAGTNIRNNSTDEIRLVILSLRKQEPIFIPGGHVETLRFGLSNFSNKLEIYRYNVAKVVRDKS